MEEYSDDAFVNRESRIPVIHFDNQDDVSNHGHDDGSVKQGKDRSARSKFGDKARKMVGRATEKGSNMQDQLLEKYVHL